MIDHYNDDDSRNIMLRAANIPLPASTETSPPVTYIDACSRCHVLEGQLHQTQSELEASRAAFESLRSESEREHNDLNTRLEDQLMRSMSDSLAIESLRSALRQERARQHLQTQRSASPVPIVRCLGSLYVVLSRFLLTYH